MSTNPIEKISIRRFRSIEHAEIDCRALNVFVGENDAGKSNVLRALNLFFNGFTDPDSTFNFERDYCKFATVSERKAKEIVIELTLSPPESYGSAKGRKICWKKVWRREGLSLGKGEMQFDDGTEFPPRSKVSTWINRIRYKYVPAIKDKNYFAALMGDLHDTLSATVEQSIKAAALGFTKQINSHAKPILKDVFDQLGIDASIDLPDDLRVVFESLAFKSASNGIALDQRGDGVKVRHIPIILDYLSMQDNALREQGSPAFIHIWGYEEPENNLEMRRAFELARQFLAHSSRIQILLSTHSPVFYALAKDSPETVALYSVTNGVGAGTTFLAKSAATIEQIDIDMGLLPILVPHVQAANTRLAALDLQIEKLNQATEHNKKPTLYVEGPSDTEVLRVAFNAFAPESLQQLRIRHSEENGGGANWVSDQLIAQLHNRNKVRSAGLFDRDEAGTTAKQSFDAQQKAGKQNIVKSFQIPKKNLPLRLVKDYKLVFPFGIEELLPTHAWNHADAQGWLVERSNCVTDNAHLLSCTHSLTDVLHEKGLDEAELRLFLKCVGVNQKKAFSRYVASLAKSDASNLESLQTLVEDIVAHLVPSDAE